MMILINNAPKVQSAAGICSAKQNRRHVQRQAANLFFSVNRHGGGRTLSRPARLRIFIPWAPERLSPRSSLSERTGYLFTRSLLSPPQGGTRGHNTNVI
jgi:hypothetical protein